MSWKYVQRNSETGQYRTTDQGGGSGTAISDLSDVQFNNLTDHQPLRYNATSQKWVNGADSYPPLIYSDNEREVGVWRDGKPLYQKIFTSSYTTTSGTSWQVTDIDLSSCNIDTFIDAKALRESGNGLVIFDAITQFGLSTNNHLQILFEVSTPNYTLKYVTLLYTKTTDTAGSGSWTTQGTPTQHYSTTEHVVGTWINGKPLYECTFDLGSGGMAVSSSFTDSIIPAGDIETIVSVVNACDLNSGGTIFWGGIAAYLPTGASYVKLQTDRNSGTSTIRYITIQYTKTTD